MIGRETAARVIASHGTSDLKAICKAEGLVVKTRHPWLARFDDTYVYPHIFVPRHLPPPKFRTLVAHSLGHHFLHNINQVWLRGFDRIWSWKQEHQAEELAAWLTIPASEEPELAYMGLEDVARKYRVDEELAALRMQGRGEGAPPGTEHPESWDDLPGRRESPSEASTEM